MQVTKTTYLKLISLVQLENWSSYALLGKNLIYTQKYPFVKIGYFLKRNKIQVSIQNGILYKRATIKINGNGITLRNNIEIDGKDIGTKNQFLIKEGQFLLSKIDARNGAFGVVPKELDNGVITGNFWTFDVDYSQINPHYLTLLTGTKKFQELSQTASVGTTNRNYLQEKSFLNFEIPLPSLLEQERILNAYNEKIKQAKILELMSNYQNDEIDNYLFEKLGISKQISVEKSSKLSHISLSELSVWGADRLLRGGNKSILYSSKYPNQKLGNVVYVNPRTDLSKIKDTDSMSFIPMECVSDEYGEIKELREGQKSRTTGYTKFQEGDLIWARITPCMQNGKSTIVRGLNNGLGYGSTEFHVLRKKDVNFSLEFAYHILRTKAILQDAVNHFTGSAGQQRVPKEYLENLLIPVPPISIQNEISEYIFKSKAEIKEKKMLAERKRMEAKHEFEHEIFGK